MVERLSTEALHKIIEGRFEDTATCIVKFYANNCHYCHSLKDYYEDIADQYSDGENLHFFAGHGKYTTVQGLLTIFFWALFSKNY